MQRTTWGAAVVASILSVTGPLVGAGPAHAAGPVPETAAEAYSDLMAVQDATLTARTGGYVLRAQGASEGGWSWVETFDSTDQTIRWQPSSGTGRLYTPTTTFVSLVRSTRARAILTLAGRPAASWLSAYTLPANPDYRLSLGHEFDLFVAAVPAPPVAGIYDVIDSAVVESDVDGSRHWVVQHHFWSGGVDRPASPSFLVDADPQGRLSALTSGDGTSSETAAYGAQSVPRPTAAQYLPWDTYALAEATYTLRYRVVAAAAAIVREAQGYAARHHRALAVTDLRYEAPRIAAALPSSVVPVRTSRVAPGVEVYGRNPFARSWVVYYVSLVRHRAVVTRIR